MPVNHNLKKANPTFAKIPIAIETLSLLDAEDSQWAVIESIINWVDVNLKSNNNQNPIPSNAWQLYLINQYFCAVREGGHANYIAITSTRAGKYWTTVLCGLMKLNKIEYRNCFLEMSNWVINNLEIAININEYSEDSKAIESLKTLDEKLFLLDSEFPLCKILNQWIETWQEIEYLH